jgi:serine/threonine protein kinase
MELPWHAKHRRYELRDVIGVGGYSHVYRAYDHYICTDVAIKISLRVDGNPAAHEATMCGMLDHPHIPRLLDCFKTTRHWFLVFALEAGGELFDRIVRFPPPRCMVIADP